MSAKEGCCEERDAFIDKDELEEMLREYYDFENISEEQWRALDKQIHLMCENRGIDAEYTEEYARVCDLCCELLQIPSRIQ